LDKDKLEERLKMLQNQKEQAKELFIKCLGAIELVESMIEEMNNTKEKKGENDK